MQDIAILAPKNYEINKDGMTIQARAVTEHKSVDNAADNGEILNSLDPPGLILHCLKI